MPDERIGGDLVKGHIATMVLAVLATKPRHGYDVMRALSTRSRGVFDLGQGTVYPLLYTLEEQGLIKSAAEIVDGRRRKVYSLTSSGRRSFARRKHTWQAFQSAVNSVLAPEMMEGIIHVQ
jgi:DNA-binding PadR family transcriptional regulator